MPSRTPLSLSSETQLATMVGPYGLFQHALYTKPRLEEGYCTDDNARAVQLFAERQLTDTTSLFGKLESDLEERCWQFVVDAQTESGHFRNFRSASGQWLDQGGSEDTQARVARALAAVIMHDAQHPTRQSQAAIMLDKLLPRLLTLTYPRSIAETIIALADITNQHQVQEAVHLLWQRFWQQWEQHASLAWPWPEKKLTYANALLPHGLIVGAAALGRLSDPAVQNMIRDSVAFLITTTYRDDYFQPVGNAGWHEQNKSPARYDQQPIEAHTMLDLLLTYNRLMNEKLPGDIISAPYDWFWGRNSSRIVLVDDQRRGCYDGLTAQGVNENQGAESLLAYLRSELVFTRV